MLYFDGCYQNIGVHTFPDDSRKIAPLNFNEPRKKLKNTPPRSPQQNLDLEEERDSPPPNEREEDENEDEN